jgi:hypothetical protein
MNWDISTAEGLANAVEWQTRHVTRVTEGGFWAVPRSLSIYQLSHQRKTAMKLCGLPEPDIAKVFKAMGWTVVEAP